MNPMVLSNAVRRYRQDGFVHLPSFLDKSTVSSLRTLYDEAATLRNHSRFPAPYDNVRSPFMTVTYPVPPSIAAQLPPDRLMQRSGQAAFGVQGIPSSQTSPDTPILASTRTPQLISSHSDDSTTTSRAPIPSIPSMPLDHQQPKMGEPLPSSSSPSVTRAMKAHYEKTYAIKCKSEAHREKVMKMFKKKFGDQIKTEEEMLEWAQNADWAKSPKFREEVRQKYYMDEYHDWMESLGTHRYNLFQSSNAVRENVYGVNGTLRPLLPFGIAASLAGCLGMRLWCEDYFTKPALSSAMPLHCTLPFIGLANLQGGLETRGLTAWVLLDDVEVEQGGISCLVSSHDLMRGKYFMKVEDTTHDRLGPMFLEYGLWRKLYAGLEKHPSEQVSPLRAGDVVFINSATVHGLASNMSPCRPWSAVCYHLTPQGSVFAGVRNSAISKFFIPHYNNGIVLADDKLFPKTCYDDA
eukprot:PhF_6_TR35387/c0_g1_i1/m.51441